MPFQNLQTNFTGGELDPRLYAQVDLDRYKNGLRQARNVICQPHGPVSRRNGSRYIATAGDSADHVRLLRFQFSQDAAYILEFGHAYIRFYKDGAPVYSSFPTQYEITSPYIGLELSSITYVQFGNTLFLAQYNHPPMRLQWKGDTDWTLSEMVFDPPATYDAGTIPTTQTLTLTATTGAVTATASASIFVPGDVGRTIQLTDQEGSATITGYTSGTSVAATVTTTFPSTGPFAVTKWSIQGNLVASLQPRGTVIGSSTTIYAFDETSNGDYRPAATLTAAAVTGSGINFTASVAVFKAGDVGRILWNLTGPGVALITGFTSSTVVVCTILENWPDTNTIGSQGWSIRTTKSVFRAGDVNKYLIIQDGVTQINTVTDAYTVQVSVLSALLSRDATVAWSIETPAWTTDNGYPRSIALHQQRLVLASTKLFPQTVWMSESGLITSQAIGSENSDAISIDLSTAEVNEVQWMASLDELAVGTTGAELVISSGTNNIVLTPSTIAQKTQGYSGSNIQQPVLMEGEVIYIQRSGRKLNSFKYDVSANQMISEAITFLAEHLTVGVLKEVVVSRDPTPTIYAVLYDGTMLVGSYMRSENVLAWSLFSCQGSYKSVQTISVDTKDQVWVVVERVVNNNLLQYIELFDSGDGSENIDGFSDSYLYYSNPRSITITNGAPAQFNSSSHGLVTNNRVKFFNTGVVDLDGRTWIVNGFGANYFNIMDSNGIPFGYSGDPLLSDAVVHKLVTTVSGLGHLEGLTVQVKSDGAPSIDRVVSGGSISLAVESYEVTVGLEYTSTIETLDLVYQLANGKQQAQPVRFSRPVLRLLNSFNPTVNGEYVPARNPGMRMDNKVPLFSGDLVYGGLTYDQTGRLLIEHSDPLPLNILGIFGTIDAGMK